MLLMTDKKVKLKVLIFEFTDSTSKDTGYFMYLSVWVAIKIYH